MLDTAAFKGGNEAKGVVDLASAVPVLSLPTWAVESSVLDPLLSSSLGLLSVLVKLKVALSSVAGDPKDPKAGLALADPNANNPKKSGLKKFKCTCS